MNKIRKLNLSAWIMIGLVLGIVAGCLLIPAPYIAEIYIKPIGTLFLNIIKMIVIPLVFSSIVVGTCGLGDAKRVGRIGGKTILFYLLTTAIAVTLGLVIGNIFPMGRGLEMTALEVTTSGETVSVIDTLMNIVPTNPVAALAEGNMLQIIFFALCMGGAILIIGEKGKILHEFMDSLAESMYALIGIIMRFAPIAVFALITPVVALNGLAVLLPLLGVIATVYGACIIHILITYSIALGGIARVNPIKFLIAAAPAMIFAFSSASSSATIPFSMTATEKMGVPQSIRSFVLPLGATINMDGTAIYQGVCALFIANAYGISLGFGQQLTIILTCTLASIGTAGIPGAGVAMLSMVLASVGLPIEGIALVAGIDRILDMMRTTVNITGDIACSVVVAASEKELKGGSLSA